jgi:ribonuclease BN (tRNA processing enzyme)
MCCYLAGEEIIDHDTELISRYVLASSIEAGKLASEANVKQIALVHIREKPGDFWMQWKKMLKENLMEK